MLARAVVIVIVAVNWACGGSPTQPQSLTPSPSTGAGPAPTANVRYHVSGVVTDENGAPVANAVVTVYYASLQTGTRTDAAGGYQLDFETTQTSFNGASNVVGLLEARGAGNWPHKRLLRPGEMTVVANPRLRPIRTINAGDWTTVSIAADSSVAADDEDEFWNPGLIREKFRVTASKSGTLIVRLRGEITVEPVLTACAVDNNHCTSVAGNHGNIFFHADAGRTYDVGVAIFATAAPRSYDLSTELER